MHQEEMKAIRESTASAETLGRLMPQPRVVGSVCNRTVYNTVH